MVKPHLLMIGGWTAPIARALDVGFDVSYFGPCDSNRSFDVRILDKCKHIREVKINQTGVCLSLAKQLHQASTINAVASFTELGMETAAIISDALNVRGLDLWAVSATRYKDWMRKVLAEYPDLALPWRRLASKHDLQEFYEQSGPAIIIKPVSGAASVGVKQIKSKTELDAFCSEVEDDALNTYLAEQLVDSDDLYSVESLTIEGVHTLLALSVSKMTGYPYTIQNHTVVPAYGVDIALREKIAGVVKRFLSAIHLKNGVAHTEVKLSTDGQPLIIESQTRVGGDRIWRMVELTTDVKQIDLALKNLIGLPITLQDFPDSHAVAAFFCLLPPAGTVKAVANIQTLSQVKGVLEHVFDIQPSQRLTQIRNNSERKGHVLLVADNHIDLFDKFRVLTQALWVEYMDGKVWHPTF